MSKNYAAAKGQFIQEQMRAGKSNLEARKAWGKSSQAKEFNKYGSSVNIERPSMAPEGTEGSEWDDYAWNADDY